MHFPFDTWVGCARSTKPSTQPQTPSTSAFVSGLCTDVAFAYEGRHNAIPNELTLRTLSEIVRAHQDRRHHQLGVDVVLRLHRVILLRTAPRFFNQFLLPSSCCLDHSNEEKEASVEGSRFIRENRFCGEVAAVGVPVVLRYLYTGVVGQSLIERVLSVDTDAPRHHPNSEPESLSVSPLSIDGVVRTMIVAASWWGSDSRAASHEDAPPPWHMPEDDDNALGSLCRYLFDFLLSLTTVCEEGQAETTGAVKVEVDDDNNTASPPLTLPSQPHSSHSSTKPHLSPSAKLEMLIQLLKTLDDVMESQKQHNTHLEEKYKFQGAMEESKRVRSTYAAFGSVTLHSVIAARAAEPREILGEWIETMKGALSANDRNVFSAAAPVTELVSALWCKGRESVLLLTLSTLDRSLLASFVPETRMSVCESEDSFWKSCTELTTCSWGGFEYETDGSNAVVVGEPSFGASRSWLEEFGITLDGLPILLNKFPLRLLSWCALEWSRSLLIAAKTTEHSRRSATEDAALEMTGSETNEDVAQRLRDETLSHDPASSVWCRLVHIYRYQALVQLQRVAVSRLMNSVIHLLSTTPLAATNTPDDGGSTPHALDVVRRSLQVPLPDYYGIGKDKSIWQLWSEVLLSTPPRWTMICTPRRHVHLTDALTDSATANGSDDAAAGLMELWDAAIHFRDSALIQRLIGVFGTDGPSTSKVSLWSAISRASAILDEGDAKSGEKQSSGLSGRRSVAGIKRLRDDEHPPQDVDSSNPSTCTRRSLPPVGFTESLPLLSTFVNPNGETPQRNAERGNAASNPASLFTNDTSSTPLQQGLLVSWEKLLASDDDILQRLHTSVSALRQRDNDKGEKDTLGQSSDLHAGVGVVGASPEVISVSSSINSGSDVTQDSVVDEQPKLLHVEQGHRRSTSRSRPSIHCIGDLVDQLEQSRLMQRTQFLRLRDALCENILEELQEVRTSLRLVCDSTIAPALQEIRALDAVRRTALHDMNRVEASLMEHSLRIRSAEQDYMDTSTRELTRLQTLIDEQEIKICALVDSLNNKIIPELECQRSSVLEETVHRLSEAFSAVEKVGGAGGTGHN